MSTELGQLRTFYAAPGFLLLARRHGEPAGCVGVRSIDAATGEIRRLFVHPGQRGGGLGRHLLTEAHVRARAGGFNRLVLNTLPTMTSARKLYDADGYAPIEPYTDNPVDGVQYFGLTLNHLSVAHDRGRDTHGSASFPAPRTSDS